MPRDDRPSLLPHFLAGLAGLSIVYASLQPFGEWIAPLPGTPFFLFAPWPPRWTRFDALANLLAYLPLGFFVALIPRGRSAWSRLSVAVATGAALSFVMEALQMFLPPRDATVVDLLANTAGSAAGGLAALAFGRWTRLREAIRNRRERWFLPGRAGRPGARAARHLAGRPGQPRDSAVRHGVRSDAATRAAGRERPAARRISPRC